MSKELSDLFDVNRLRTLWMQSNAATNSAPGTQARATEPAAPTESSSRAPSRSIDPVEQHRLQAERSHIPQSRPDDVLRALGREINERLHYESLTLLHIWRPLQVEVAMLVPAKNKSLRTAGHSKPSSSTQLYQLIDQLDDALTSLLSERSES